MTNNREAQIFSVVWRSVTDTYSKLTCGDDHSDLDPQAFCKATGNLYVRDFWAALIQHGTKLPLSYQSEDGGNQGPHLLLQDQITMPLACSAAAGVFHALPVNQTFKDQTSVHISWFSCTSCTPPVNCLCLK